MNFLLLEQAQQDGNNIWSVLSMIAIWVVIIGFMYFAFVRPQKKKQKQEEELRNNLEIGDDVTTIGGIVGKVISLRDDDETFILETASDKTRMRFKKWAISSVDTPDKQPKEVKQEKEEKSKNKKKDKEKDIDEKKD